MSQAIELPEKLWSAVLEAAKENGMTPAGWIASHLPAPADANGAADPVEETEDNLTPPTYTSVPLERVGTVQVTCIAGKQLAPLPYPLEVPSE